MGFTATGFSVKLGPFRLYFRLTRRKAGQTRRPSHYHKTGKRH